MQKCDYGSPEDFLQRSLDAPQPQSVSSAVSLLRKMGACHATDHSLTPLGHHLAGLPVNVKIGKMLIYGAILGCLDPIVRKHPGGQNPVFFALFVFIVVCCPFLKGLLRCTE